MCLVGGAMGSSVAALQAQDARDRFPAVAARSAASAAAYQAASGPRCGRSDYGTMRHTFSLPYRESKGFIAFSSLRNSDGRCSLRTSVSITHPDASGS